MCASNSVTAIYHRQAFPPTKMLDCDPSNFLSTGFLDPRGPSGTPFPTEQLSSTYTRAIAWTNGVQVRVYDLKISRLQRSNLNTLEGIVTSPPKRIPALNSIPIAR
jgi:hypothetical protein